jgi:hypothetical protein
VVRLIVSSGVIKHAGPLGNEWKSPILQLYGDL